MMSLVAYALAVWLQTMPPAFNGHALPGFAPYLPPLPIAAKRLPEFLTSGDNDLITIRQRRVGASRADLVSVCLVNNSRSGGRKAFDNHLTSNPRFTVDAGECRCADLHPTRHDLVFWKRGSDGALKPVLKQRFNLSGHAGRLVVFEWIDD